MEIRDGLRRYHVSRFARVKDIVKSSGDLTQLQAYDGCKFYFIQRWLTPIIGLNYLASIVAEMWSRAPELSCVRLDERRGSLG